MHTLIKKVIQEIKGVTQNTPHHCYDLLGHTQRVVAYLKSHGANEQLVLAGWLHDVGKAQVKRFDTVKGYEIFHGHAKASVAWAEKHFPQVSIEVLSWVKYHDLTFESPKTVARYLRKYGIDWVENLLLLQRADKMAQSTFQRSEKLEKISLAQQWLRKLI